MNHISTALTAAFLVTAGASPGLATAAPTRGDDSVPTADVGVPVGESLRLDAGAARFNLGNGAIATAPTQSQGQADDWRVEFNTWAWLFGIDGDIGVRGLTTGVSASFLDTLEASDSLMAFSGRLEVAKGRWGGFIDGMYANVGVDDVTGPLGHADIDITVEIVLVDFGAMYRFGEWVPEGKAADNSRDTTLDLYAGGRYTGLETELDPASSDARSGSKDWVDPIVGAKLVLPVNEKWHLAVNGDVGGFGVESDFAWSVTGVAGVDFTVFKHPATAFFGYRALGQDYTEGSGTDQFTWDVVLHGPILGFSFLF